MMKFKNYKINYKQCKCANSIQEELYFLNRKD